MKRVLFAVVLLGVAGCESSPRLPISLPPRAAEPQPPAPPRPVAAPAPVTDTCGAKPMQSLVGRPRTEIPIPVRPDRQRVLCTTCPMTMDYRPDRLNFLFDATTGLIKQIRCG